MAGFGGSTGVPLKQMQDAIAQSTAYEFSESTTLSGITASLNQIVRVGNTVVFSLKGTVDTTIPGYTSGRIVVPAGFRPRSAINVCATYKSGSTINVEQCQILTDGNIRFGSNVPTGALAISIVYVI